VLDAELELPEFSEESRRVLPPLTFSRFESDDSPLERVKNVSLSPRVKPGAIRA